MVIALRRGVDYVPTGLYDPAAKKADGSNRFSTTDFVVKYKLTSINPSDTNIYKNPVRIVSGSSPTQYCVVHDDGTAYVLDDYNPYNKTYSIDGQDSGSYAGLQSSVQAVWKSKTNSRSIRRFEYTDVMQHCWYPEFMMRPVGHSYSAGIHYYPSGGNATPFTYYYYDDANGVPVESTGSNPFWRTDPSDFRSVFDGTSCFETTGFHQLFFEGEKFTFINAQVNGSDLATWGTVTDGASYGYTLIESQTTLERTFYKSAITSLRGARNTSQFWNNGNTGAMQVYARFIVPALDGLLVDTATGKRYDYIARAFWGVQFYFTTSRLPSAAEMTSAAVSLQSITIPSVTVPNSTTISFIDTTPAPSTGNTLKKGIDYVPTGIYDSSKFKSDLVVRCKINGAYYKYAVAKVNGSPSFFCVTHTDPVTNKQTVYSLDGFDPFERYYWQWSVYGKYYRANGNDDVVATKNGRAIARYGNTFPAFFAPPGYSYTPGNSTMVDYLGADQWSWDTAAAGNFYYVPTATGTKTEFSHFHFDDTGEPITYLNSVFLYQANTVRSGKMATQTLHWHRLLLDGEKCNFILAKPDLFGRTLATPISNFGPYQTKTTCGVNWSLSSIGGQPYCPVLYSSWNLEISWAVKVVGSKVREYNFDSTNTAIFDKCVIPSTCGLYVGSDGKRYDYLQLANRAGLYVPVESATSMLSMSQITTETGGLLVRRIFDDMPSFDLITSLQAQIAADLVIIDGLKAQLNSVITALNSAKTTVASNLSDPAALQTQISSLTTQANAATDTTVKNLLNAQIAILQQIQAVQTSLSNTTGNLTTSQSQVATIIGFLNNATTSIASNVSDPTVLQTQISGLQSQIAATSDPAARAALTTQLGILQQIQAVQSALQQSNVSLSDAQNQIASVTTALNNAQAEVAAHLSDPAALDSQISAIAAQLSNTTDTATKNLLTAQLAILNQIRDTQLSLRESNVNLTASQAQIASIIDVLGKASAGQSQAGSIQSQITALQNQILATTDPNVRATLTAQLNILQQVQSVELVVSQSGSAITEARAGIVSFVNNINSARLQVSENVSDPTVLNDEIAALQTQLAQTNDSAVRSALTAQIGILTQIRDIQQALQAQRTANNAPLIERLQSEAKWKWMIYMGIGAVIAMVVYALYHYYTGLGIKSGGGGLGVIG